MNKTPLFPGCQTLPHGKRLPKCHLRGCEECVSSPEVPFCLHHYHALPADIRLLVETSPSDKAVLLKASCYLSTSAVAATLNGEQLDRLIATLDRLATEQEGE